MTSGTRERQPSVACIVVSVLAAVAVILLGDLIVAFLSGTRQGILPSIGSIAHLAGFGAIIVLSLLAAVLIATVLIRLAARCETSIPKVAILLRALAIMIPLSPLIIRTSRLLFEGGMMRRFSCGGLGPAAVALGGFLSAWWIFALIRKARLGTRPIRRTFVAAALFVVFIPLVYFVDERFFTHQYHFLHQLLGVGLYLGAFFGCLLLVGWRAGRPPGRGATGSACVSLALILACGGLAAWHLRYFSAAPVPVRRLLGLELATARRLTTLIPYRRENVARQDAVSGAPLLSRQSLQTRELARDRMAELRPRSQLPNVIWFSIDAVRADHCSFLGYARPTTPFLSELAERSFVFTNARSSTVSTSIAIISMVSGVYPATVVARNGADPAYLAPHLGAHGFETVGIISPGGVFGTRSPTWPEPDRTMGFRTVRHHVKSESEPTIDQILADVSGFRGKPFFVFTHVFDPHHTYEKHPGFDFGNGGADRYDSEIAFVDSQLRRLWNRLEDLGLTDTTILVVTADHGEEFGEHGGVYHGGNVYDVQCRVPILIHVPFMNLTHRKDIHAAVANNSIVATLTDLLGLPPAPDAQAPSLLPLMLDLEDESEHFAIVEMSRATASRSMRAVVQGSWKLINNLSLNLQELYDLEADPGETTDLADEKPEIVARLQELERSWYMAIQAAVRGGESESGEAPLPAEYLRIRSLAQEGHRPSILAAMEHLTSDDPRIRKDAARLVFDSILAAGGGALAFDFGVGVTDDPYVHVLAESLAFAAGKREDPDELLQALGDEDPEVRVRVARCLRFHPERIKSVDAVRAHFERETETTVRFELAGLLCVLSVESAIEPLVAMMPEGNREQRRRALTALAGFDDRLVWDQLLSLSRQGSDQHKDVIAALEGHDSPLRRAWLLSQFTDRSGGVRNVAYITLASFRDPDLLRSVFLPALVYDPGYHFRKLALKLLSPVKGEDITRGMILALQTRDDMAETLSLSLWGRLSRPVREDALIAIDTSIPLKKGEPVTLLEREELFSGANAALRVVALVEPAAQSTSEDVVIVRDAAGRQCGEGKVTGGLSAVAARVTLVDGRVPLPLTVERLGPGAVQRELRIIGVMATRIRHELSLWPSSFSNPTSPHVYARFSEEFRTLGTRPAFIWSWRPSGTYRFWGSAAAPESVVVQVCNPAGGQKLRLSLNGTTLFDGESPAGCQVIEVPVPRAAWLADAVNALSFDCSKRQSGTDGPVEMAAGAFLGISRIDWK